MKGTSSNNFHCLLCPSLLFFILHGIPLSQKRRRFRPVRLRRPTAPPKRHGPCTGIRHLMVASSFLECGDLLHSDFLPRMGVPLCLFPSVVPSLSPIRHRLTLARQQARLGGGHSALAGPFFSSVSPAVSKSAESSPTASCWANPQHRCPSQFFFQPAASCFFHLVSEPSLCSVSSPRKSCSGSCRWMSGFGWCRGGRDDAVGV